MHYQINVSLDKQMHNRLYQSNLQLWIIHYKSGFNINILVFIQNSKYSLIWHSKEDRHQYNIFHKMKLNLETIAKRSNNLNFAIILHLNRKLKVLCCLPINVYKLRNEFNFRILNFIKVHHKVEKSFCMFTEKCCTSIQGVGNFQFKWI